MAAGKDGYGMASEFCRDVAVLVFVFGPLDIWLKAIDGTLKLSTTDTVSAIVGVFALAMIFGSVGAAFEKWRER
jgi:hypothetical protein